MKINKEDDVLKIFDFPANCQIWQAGQILPDLFFVFLHPVNEEFPMGMQLMMGNGDNMESIDIFSIGTSNDGKSRHIKTQKGEFFFPGSISKDEKPVFQAAGQEEIQELTLFTTVKDITLNK